LTSIVKVDSRPRIVAEGLSILFFAVVVAAANCLSLAVIIFPELGALASDVMLRPAGKWAKEPWKLIATPVVTAALGIAIGRYFPFSAGTILFAMTLCIGVVFALRSKVAPAISAGILPIVLGVKSWLYPVSVLCSLILLTVLLIVWKQTPYGKALIPIRGKDDRAVDILESPPHAKAWFPALFLFVAVMGTAAQLTTWRFLLFPPLIVMAYEMLGHPTTCPWAKQPYPFPVVCTLAAAFGVVCVKVLGVTPIAASVSLVVTYGVMRTCRLRMPPALAVGLIPLVIEAPSWKYAASVGIGTTALTVWFLIYRRLLLPLRISP